VEPGGHPAGVETTGRAAGGRAPEAVDWAALRRALGGIDPATGAPEPGPYAPLAVAALRGEPPDRETARNLLGVTGRDLAHLLGAALTVRERYFGRRVKICVLENARSGLCPEDCHYCSQSAVSTADIDQYRLRSVPRMVAAARRATAAGARRFCMVVSGRGPSDADIACFSEVARTVRAECDLELCVSAGLMRTDQAHRLREAGVGWVNHNLNTSERHYPVICTTHTYGDRVETLRNARAAGLALCSGVIMGMGENDDDLVDVAGALRELRVESLPVNFLHPIDGTPLAGRDDLDVGRALAGLCLFRLFNPTSDIRAAGGRERTLGVFQPLALYAATSIFADGYLTTPGQPAAGARAMVEAMGFSVEG
jgi:biotin synthase